MSLVLVFVSLVRHLNMPPHIVTVKKMEIMKNWSETGKLILDSTELKTNAQNQTERKSKPKT